MTSREYEGAILTYAQRENWKYLTNSINNYDSLLNSTSYCLQLYLFIFNGASTLVSTIYHARLSFVQTPSFNYWLGTGQTSEWLRTVAVQPCLTFTGHEEYNILLFCKLYFVVFSNRIKFSRILFPRSQKIESSTCPQSPALSTVLPCFMRTGNIVLFIDISCLLLTDL